MNIWQTLTFDMCVQSLSYHYSLKSIKMLHDSKPERSDGDDVLRYTVLSVMESPVEIYEI